MDDYPSGPFGSGSLPPQELPFRSGSLPAQDPHVTDVFPAQDPRFTGQFPAQDAQTTGSFPAQDPRTTGSFSAQDPRLTGSFPAQDSRATGQFPAQGPDPYANPAPPANGISMHNGRVEAQDVSQAYDYYFMPDSGKSKRRRKSRGRRRRDSRSDRPRRASRPRRARSRRVPLWVKFLLGLVATAVVACGAFALVFWRSAQTVNAQASAAVSQANEIKTSFKDGDFTAMSASVQRMNTAAKSMRDEVNGPVWDAAAAIPQLGGDIGKIRSFANIFCDLVDNAAVPMIEALEDRSLSDVLGTDGYIDLDLLNDFIGGLQNAAVVIERDLEEVNEVGDADFSALNERMVQARTQMSSIDGVLDHALELLGPLPAMLGDNGVTRRYLVNAIQPGDERATGGTAGCTGVLEITNGQISLGSFSDYLPNDVGVEQLPTMLAGELEVFGEGLRSNPVNSTMTPDYPRAANVFRQAWVRDNGLPVDGVIAVDPTFLQWVLRYVGGVKATAVWDTFDKEGEFLDQEIVAIEIDGKNASQVLSHDVYNRVLEYGPQEAIFSDLAHNALHQLLYNLNKIGFNDFIDLMGRAGDEQHLKIWMLDEDEEMTIRKMGFSGVLQHVTTEAPELGVYVNDYTWGQMGWYLDLKTKIDDGIPNEDGSTTYQVTTTVHNVATVDDAKVNSDYVLGANLTRRNDGDMCTELLLFAPAGGRIENVELESTYPVWMPAPMRVYDLDLYTMRFWTNLGETSTVTYTVTTSPDAPSRLRLRQTPTCRTF